ncbi:MAG: hypothetical protein QM487_02840 [Candidatus Marithrix sp.]
MIKRVALLFSGHIRNNKPCVQPLLNNFINVLRDNNYQVDIFSHFWNVAGHHNNWIGIPDFRSFNELNPKMITMENFNRNYFVEKFKSTQWLYRPRISCHATSGDAASMHYMIKKSFDNVLEYQAKHQFKYDLYVRLRSDIYLTSKLSILEVNDAINSEALYLPEWNGNHEIINKKIMPHFAFGNFKVMNDYMTVFDDIESYIRRNDITHTREGFLYEKIKNLPIKTTSLKYDLQRDQYLYKLWN